MSIDYELSEGDMLEVTTKTPISGLEVRTGILLKLVVENGKKIAQMISGDNLYKDEVYSVRPFKFPPSQYH